MIIFLPSEYVRCYNFHMVKDYYSSTEVTKALGISKERIRDWLLRLYVEPSFPSEGQGKKALFSFNDILSIRLFQSLLDVGFSRKIASEIKDQFIKMTESFEGKLPSIAVFRIFNNTVSATFAAPIDHEASTRARRPKEEEYSQKKTAEEELQNFRQMILKNVQLVIANRFTDPEAKLWAAIGEDWDYIHAINIDRLVMDVQERLRAL